MLRNYFIMIFRVERLITMKYYSWSFNIFLTTGFLILVRISMLDNNAATDYAIYNETAINDRLYKLNREFTLVPE